MRYGAMILVVTGIVAGATLAAYCEPVLTLGTGSGHADTRVSIDVGLSGNAEPLAGINGKILLPDGVSCSGVTKGPLLSGAFSLDYEAAPMGPDTAVTVIAYSGTASLTAASGELLTLDLDIGPGLTPGDYPVAFAATSLSPYVKSAHAVSDDAGAMSLSHDTVDGQLTVLSGAVPAADFTASVTSGPGPLTVWFTDTSSPGTGGIETWSWDFGDDSSSSSDQHPTHVYTSMGQYTVALTVANGTGSDTETKGAFITVTSDAAMPAAGTLGLVISCAAVALAAGVFMARRNRAGKRCGSIKCCGIRILSVLMTFAVLAIANAAVASGSGITDQPAGWWSSVQKDIAAREYHVTWQEKTVLDDVPAAYQAPNRAHDLRAYFTERGVRLIRRTEEKPTWQLSLELVRLGKDAAKTVPAVAHLAAAGNRIDCNRGDLLTEWYVNTIEGLEQGFTVAGSLEDGCSELVLAIAVTGDLKAETTADGDVIAFVSRGGVAVLHYSDLVAVDVNGKSLPARMTLASGGRVIELHVDARDAMFPVTIDPMVTTAGWSPGTAQAGSRYAYSLGCAGDVNGDGYDDVIVGAPNYDRGESDEGRVFVYHGSLTGPSAGPDWTAESDQVDALFGNAVSTAGDVNGDGYDDLIVGANGYSNGETGEGAAFLFLGSRVGLRRAWDWVAEGGQGGAGFGCAVSTAGDVDGDGYDEVIVGANGYDGGESNEGAAYVYYGSPSGLSVSPDWMEESEQVDAQLGTSVATAGDVDGDGYADIIIGVPYMDSGETDEGRVLVYLGSGSGLSANPDWWAQSDEDHAHMGCVVSAAGDVNGDGYGDVIVGAAGYDNGGLSQGAAFIWFGSTSDLGAPGTPANADWLGDVDQDGAAFGCSVSTGGDVDGDGYDEVIVGASLYDNGETNEGGAFVYYGSGSGPAVSPGWTGQGDQADASYGFCVASAGDVNGDGLADLLVGSPDWDDLGADEGRAWLYYGPELSLGIAPTGDWTAESNQAGALYGFSVSCAGDVNNDGYDDIIVGAPYYDNGSTDEGCVYVYYGDEGGPSTIPDWTGEANQGDARFGHSVSTAGDVQNDGYDDIIVGAPRYDRGEANECMAFVWFGSVSGLGANGHPGNYDWGWDVDKDYSSTATSVSTAGDVNGDGYDDVLIGAPNHESGSQVDEGVVFAFYGNAGGLPSSPSWTAQSDQAEAYLGVHVSSAGDVNGDGYDDVVLGAHQYSAGQTQEGMVLVYHGSASGLHGSVPGNAAWRAYGDRTGAHLGRGASSAGDVNGDGYDDVIVGAPNHGNGEVEEGRAYVWLGSPSGLGPNGNPGNADWVYESNESNAYFGLSLGRAGDLNADGYSDVVVGASGYDGGGQDSGRASIFCGSDTGLRLAPSLILDGDRANAGFGYSVSAAGDVNGDGYDDLLIGARRYDNPATDEGAAFLYYGPLAHLSGGPSWTGEGEANDLYLGYSVSVGGDVNGDGYDDVVVGAPRYDGGETNEGAVFVYHGSANGVGTGRAWTTEGDQAFAYYGYSVSTAGDVNGDWYDDIVIGAYRYDNGEIDEGRAYVYHGTSAGLDTVAAWLGESDQAQARFGASVSDAGDVNDDGYDDVIIGAPLCDNGEVDEGQVFVYHGSSSGLSATADWTAESDQANAEYGTSVSAAGDIDGDEYGDIVIGAPLYDNGETDEGMAFVYRGSSLGLDAMAAWAGESDQSGASYGCSVSDAGDVNGDGYGDIIVGACLYDTAQTDKGRAYVYHGSAVGLSGAADWMGADGQANAHFGWSVSGAGDVNSDGYDDVIMGAPHHSNGESEEGRAYVHLGSSSGIDSAPVWQAEGNQISAYFGAAVSGGGDLNGDGAGDIAVGAYAYDGGETDEGRVCVYYGGVAAFSGTATRHSTSGDAPATEFGPSIHCSINYASGTALSTETVTRFRHAPDDPPAGLGLVCPVHWRITTDRTAFVAEVTFRYTDAEVAGMNESRLVVYFSATGEPGTWAVAGTSHYVDDVRNEVTISGLTELNGFFALGVEPDVEAPTAVITLDDPQTTDLDVIHFSVDFDESVAPSFGRSDVSVIGTVAAASPVSVVGPDPTYTVTVTMADPEDDGTVGIEIGTGVVDTWGNPYAGGSSGLYHIHNWHGFTAEPSGTVRLYTGDSHSVSVAVDVGNSVPSYQWKWDDGLKAIHDVGIDSPTLDLPDVTGLDGDYWCEVSYDGETYVSGSATLDVADHLQITQQPEGGHKVAGESHTFSVATSGGHLPLTYVWTHDGEPITEVTGSSYTITSVTPDDAGTYTVTVSDDLTDSTGSTPAALTVAPAMPIAGPALLLLSVVLLLAAAFAFYGGRTHGTN